MEASNYRGLYPPQTGGRRISGRPSLSEDRGPVWGGDIDLSLCSFVRCRPAVSGSLLSPGGGARREGEHKNWDEMRESELEGAEDGVCFTPGPTELLLS